MERRPHRRPAPVFGGNSGRNAGGNVCARILYEQERGVCPLCAAVFGGGQAERRQESEAGSYGQQVRVNIAGAQYAFATTDSEKYITSLADKLDRDIGKLMEANTSLPVTKAAVFCAMDYLDEYQKSTGSAEKYAQPDPGLHRGRSPGPHGRGQAAG